MTEHTVSAEDKLSHREWLFHANKNLIEQTARRTLEAGYASEKMLIFLIEASSPVMEELIHLISPTLDLEPLKRRGIPVICGAAGTGLLEVLGEAFVNFDFNEIRSIPHPRGEMSVLVFDSTGLLVGVVNTQKVQLQ